MTGTAPIMRIHHHLLLRTIAGFMLTMATFGAIAANTIAPKGYQGFEGKIHSTAAQACAEFDKAGHYTAAGGPAWDDFFKEVRCSYKDSDGAPGEWETHVECPDDSSVEEIDKCVCWGDKVASGNTCVDPDKAKQQGQVTQQPKAANPKASGDCELDKLNGSALRSSVVSQMQRQTDDANRRLIENPRAAAEAVPSIGRGLFTGDYGTLLENLVAQSVERDTCLSKYVRHLSATEQSRTGADGAKGDHPDFRGIPPSLSSLEIDITTADAAAKKRGNEGGKAAYVYIVYERGLCMDTKSGLAVKIPNEAGKAKVKNGLCPESWK
jgi:hypothetical protein